MRLKLIIILLGMPLCLAAQRHSMFLGLPLGGDRDVFVDSLEAKGFVFKDEDKECTVLVGLFDGVGARIGCWKILKGSKERA